MVKLSFYLLALILLVSCGVRVDAGYFFKRKPYFKLERSQPTTILGIDTSSIYVRTRTSTTSIPTTYTILRFFPDGRFLEVRKVYKLELTQWDFAAALNSVNWGRYSINGTTIKREIYFPQQPPSKRWTRDLKRGEIRGDTIEIFDKFYPEKIYYIKSQVYYFKDGVLHNK